jgi:multimeric flavodoxin WrbA
MTHLLALNGSYRENGTTDQAVSEAAAAAMEAGASVEIIQLRDFPIEFCVNCRHCTQAPGDAPGTCIHDDRMKELIARIEAADGYILASPTNFSSVTAVFKRFMERLVVYAWWPWGTPAPKYRHQKATKRAMLITSSAAPAILARFSYASLKQLKITARTIGAKPAGSVFIGLMSQQPDPVLPEHAKRRLRTMAKKLVR